MTNIVVRLEASPDRGDALRMSALGRYLGKLASALTTITTRTHEDLVDVLDWEIIRARAESPLELAITPSATKPDAVLPPADALLAPFEEQLSELTRVLENATTGVAQHGLACEFLRATQSILEDIAQENFGRVALMVERDDRRTPILEASSPKSKQWVDLIEAMIEKSRPLPPEWREIGSLVGRLIEAKPYYNKPAFRVREVITGANVLCRIPEKLADEFGEAHKLNEVWKEARILVMGTIERDIDGKPKSVVVSKMEKLEDSSDTAALIGTLRQGDGGMEDAWGDRVWGYD